MITLHPEQLEALKKLDNGMVLAGGVGVGKSLTSLAYYFTKVQDGRIDEETRQYYPPADLKDIPLIIITTAKKRDDLEWFDEVVNWNVPHDYATVDSWNNISKYTTLKDCFFIFDEQKVAGSGAWVRHFLKIAKSNRWLLLSATPGDKWINYLPLFMANGLYRTRREFTDRHVVYKPYMQFPVIDRYVDTEILKEYRSRLLVPMKAKRIIPKRYMDVMCKFDDQYMKQLIKERKYDGPEGKAPIINSSQLSYLTRLCVNTDPSRLLALKTVLDRHKRVIVFYTYTEELNAILSSPLFKDVVIAQHNGRKHEKVPDGPEWLYLCQYSSAAEAWNCISTNCIVFYSLDHAWWRMTQAAGRINRGNTPYPILYYYRLVSNSSIDFQILKALNEKEQFNQAKFTPKEVFAPVEKSSGMWDFLDEAA